MASIIATTKKYMLYNKRQHLQHTVPRPLQIKPMGHALSKQVWEKFSKQYLIPIKLHHFCERSGHGDLIFFGESGIEAAKMLDQKFPGRFHFFLEAQGKNKAMIGLALAKAAKLKIFEVSYKENRNNVHNINVPEILEALTEEGQHILTVANVKLA